MTKVFNLVNTITITKLKKRPWAYALAATLAATVLIAAIVAAGANTFRSDDHRAAQTTALQTSEDDTIVASANHESITLRELREGVMHLQQMKASAETELQGLSENTGAPTNYLEDRHNLVLEWGDENVALAGLIQDRILHQKAVELGYEATDEEINESRQYARQAHDNRELDPYNQAYIDSIRADTYFDEVYPVLAARSISINNLQSGIAQEKGNTHARIHWHTFEEEVINAADIYIPESEEHSATIDGVLGFLDSLRETNRNHLRKLLDIPVATE